MPSPAAALSPLPPSAVHALPFVPRPVAMKPAASASSGGAPASPSLRSLKKEYKRVLQEARGRWPLQPASLSAASSSAGDREDQGDDASSAPLPRAAPRVRLDLPSVVTAPPPAQHVHKPHKPRTYAAVAHAPKSSMSHDLKGVPNGCVRRVPAVCDMGP